MDGWKMDIWVMESDRRQRGNERDKTEPVTLDERASHCGLQLGLAGGRA